ncbi:hypothetical protein PC114_g21337 [Phytophthora cactorum]|nr:hypothetical protein PC114_g21337 [Phytophthora cactorum]KAG3135583.1 hypothetical protein C6341_g21717 [Phytophthora cactorum]KAG3149752.1 hypothetical protein PC128_g23355 [Phytophthora cactorum]
MHFIVHRHYRKVKLKRAPKHSAFFETLMEQLLAVDSLEAFEQIEQATTVKERAAASLARGESTQCGQVSEDVVETEDGHHLEENPDTVDCDQGVKRRHRSRKVCAVYKSKPRKYTNPECSSGNRRYIWHEDWKNGNDIPRTLLLEHKLRNRPPPAHPGKKRARTAPARRDVSGDDENGRAAQNARAGSSDERVVDS